MNWLIKLLIRSAGWLCNNCGTINQITDVTCCHCGQAKPPILEDSK